MKNDCLMYLVIFIVIGIILLKYYILDKPSSKLENFIRRYSRCGRSRNNYGEFYDDDVDDYMLFKPLPPRRRNTWQPNAYAYNERAGRWTPLRDKSHRRRGVAIGRGDEHIPIHHDPNDYDDDSHGYVLGRI